MPSSRVSTFSDAADFAENIRAGQFDLTVLRRGEFRAKLTRIDLPRLWMQRFSESLPRIVRAATSSTRAIVSFPVGEHAAQHWGGRELAPGSVHRLGVGQEIYQSSSGPAETAAMSLPVEEFSAIVSSITHRSLKLHSHGVVVRPPADAMANLVRLHEEVTTLAETMPSILQNAEATRSLEHQLIHAMVACVAEPAEEDSLAVRQHQLILRRFRDLIDTNVGNPLYLPEICAAIGVSSRTLQRCCDEQMGVSPLRFLMLRRLHMVRRVLASAPRAPGIVTTIALNHGFWELGRFSVAYRQLFGETPSATLNRRR